MDKTPTTACIDGSAYHPLPHWQPVARLRGGPLPMPLRRWLRYPGSLTGALMAACSASLTVELLSQQGARATRDEARALAMPVAEMPMVRQVRLCCGGVPWVFARTVVPHASLRGGTGRLLQLGTRPLGAVLFANPAVRRGRLEVARLRPNDTLYRMTCQAAPGSTRERWARRCLYHLEAGPLLVTEVFLPTLMESGWCPPSTYGVA